MPRWVRRQAAGRERVSPPRTRQTRSKLRAEASGRGCAAKSAEQKGARGGRRPTPPEEKAKAPFDAQRFRRHSQIPWAKPLPHWYCLAQEMKHDPHALRSALAKIKTGLRLLATPEAAAQVTEEEHLELTRAMLASHAMLQEFVEDTLRKDSKV